MKRDVFDAEWGGADKARAFEIANPEKFPHRTGAARSRALDPKRLGRLVLQSSPSRQRVVIARRAANRAARIARRQGRAS